MILVFLGLLVILGLAIRALFLMGKVEDEMKRQRAIIESYEKGESERGK